MLRGGFIPDIQCGVHSRVQADAFSREWKRKPQDRGISAIPAGHPAIIQYEEIRPALLALVGSRSKTFTITLVLAKRGPTVLVGIDQGGQGHDELFLALDRLFGSGRLQWMGIPISATVLGKGSMPHLHPMGLQYQQHPTPGASIGAAPWLQGGGSLGGYLHDEKDDKLYAITCAHLFFDHTKQAMLPSGTKVVQPSNEDHKIAQDIKIIQMAEIYKSMLKLEPWEIRKQNQRMDSFVKEAEKWQELEDEVLGGTIFGTLTNIYEFGPVFDSSIGNALEPYLIDYVLMKVESRRVGVNNIDSQPCWEMAPLENGATVRMFGRTTGAVWGMVNGVCAHVSGFPQFPDKTFTLNTIVAPVKGGDSGCLVAAGHAAVGMLFASRTCPYQPHKSLAFVHDLPWLVARINQKWGLQLKLL